MFDELFKRSGLSLDRLANFLAVVDAGSIAAAADNGSTVALPSRNSK